MNLRKNLFWDVKLESIDLEQHAKFIVERILQRGTWEEFKATIDFYGKQKVKSIIKRLRYLDDRTLHFCHTYFEIPLTELRCYNIKQSKVAHWNY